ncbi:hypothetical protein ACTWQF_17810 [Streptomyces sp. 8N114]|uniref:hypothetical protein n=1 Tax=Streptomyces sp. 8N114 TaxID=3457419 RepID=UPI003FD0A78D
MCPLTGGNRNDVTQLLPLRTRSQQLPDLSADHTDRSDTLPADLGYDHDKYRRLLRKRGIRRVVAVRVQPHGSGPGIFRWVVKSTISWLHGFCRLRIRWERRDDIHEAFLGLAPPSSTTATPNALASAWATRPAIAVQSSALSDCPCATDTSSMVSTASSARFRAYVSMATASLTCASLNESTGSALSATAISITAKGANVVSYSRPYSIDWGAGRRCPAGGCPCGFCGFGSTV